MKEIQHYVLFPNHDNAMRLYKEVKALGVKAAIVPTPRAASKCCGVSLRIAEKDIEKVRECAATHNVEILNIAAVEKDVNPNRDRYC